MQRARLHVIFHTVDGWDNIWSAFIKDYIITEPSTPFVDLNSPIFSTISSLLRWKFKSEIHRRVQISKYILNLVSSFNQGSNHNQ